MSRRLIVRGNDRQRSSAQQLLDGLIIYRQDLGDLGKQLERMLREGGLRSSLDPTFSMRLH